jgi:hypothetical protein
MSVSVSRADRLFIMGRLKPAPTKKAEAGPYKKKLKPAPHKKLKPAPHKKKVKPTHLCQAANA